MLLLSPEKSLTCLHIYQEKFLPKALFKIWVIWYFLWNLKWSHHYINFPPQNRYSRCSSWFHSNFSFVSFVCFMSSFGRRHAMGCRKCVETLVAIVAFICIYKFYEILNWAWNYLWTPKKTFRRDVCVGGGKIEKLLEMRLFGRHPVEPLSALFLSPTPLHPLSVEVVFIFNTAYWIIIMEFDSSNYGLYNSIWD
jgi:hypothetical protein